MKNKAALTIIELVLMLAVFAAAAALCTSALVWAHQSSAACAARDQALLRAQNAAELLKSRGGDPEDAAAILGGTGSADGWVIHYDEAWEQTEEKGKYTLFITREDSEAELLGLARIQVLCGDSCLVEIRAAWQEVKPHER